MPVDAFPGFTRCRLDTGEAQINLVHGGDGPPLLLLHGYPQTHLMWRKIAPQLAEHFTVVCPDLRGYGDSSAPPSDPEHAAYSKRAMAADQVRVMQSLGFDEFHLAGHDRGGRVAHRLALDHPERVTKLAVLDIAPTRHMYLSADREMATAYYHWFFLIQPAPLPERMIGADPEFFLRTLFSRWSSVPGAIDEVSFAEYLRCFSRPETLHATCEDYRAAAGIDLAHDAADLATKLSCPLLVLWAAQGFVGRKYDVLATWRERAQEVSGQAIPDCGHLFPEEQPQAVTEALTSFFDY
jgi:haloacetate dehalogenase